MLMSAFILQIIADQIPTDIVNFWQTIKLMTYLSLALEKCHSARRISFCFPSISFRVFDCMFFFSHEEKKLTKSHSVANESM